MIQDKKKNKNEKSKRTLAAAITSFEFPLSTIRLLTPASFLSSVGYVVIPGDDSMMLNRALRQHLDHGFDASANLGAFELSHRNDAIEIAGGRWSETPPPGPARRLPGGPTRLPST